MDWTRRLRLQHLQLLVSLMETGNLSGTARAAHTTQPGLSKWLKELEEDVGAPLFERHARGLRPTPYGMTLFNHAQRVLTEMERARQNLEAMRSGSGSRVLLGTSPASAPSLVPRALRAFLGRYPGAQVELLEGTMNGLLERLEKRQLDVVVGRLDNYAPRASLRCEVLYSEAIVVMARPGHPLAQAAALDWEDVRRYDWIVWPPGSPIRSKLDMALTQGGRQIRCRESLSDLTTAVSMTLCQDKVLTHRALQHAGLRQPQQRLAGSAEENAAFLAEHGSLVVKPVDGEQGQGVAVDLRTADEVEEAIEAARHFDSRVLLESYHAGHDLRVLVIGYEVVAAAIRRPAAVIGDGRHSIRELIEAQSRRRQAATGGESRIPLDHETERTLRAAGYGYDDVLPSGEHLAVRRTANLHTGGILEDVTDALHPALREAAIQAARALEIPVVGLDFLVEAADQPDYVIIEANERAGLANHEPQPTAERFVDLLFPLSREVPS